MQLHIHAGLSPSASATRLTNYCPLSSAFQAGSPAPCLAFVGDNWDYELIRLSPLSLYSGCWKLVGKLTHWGRVTHICISNLTIIGSDNGLSPGRRQAIIWTNVGILLIGPLGTNFNEILIKIHTFSLKKINLKCRLENGCHFVSASMC